MKGYTLIELLVAITIATIVMTIGYAGFQSFSKRQALTSAVRKVTADLRAVQQSALSGKKPFGCFVLDGYRVKIYPTYYDINPVCGGVVNSPAVSSSPIGDITYSSTTGGKFVFKALGQGVDATALPFVITLTQTSSGKQATITISEGGQIQ